MAKTSGLRFLEALEYAKAGNKIRREGFPEGCFLYYVPPEVAMLTRNADRILHTGVLAIKVRNDTQNVWDGHESDILATDWEALP